MIEKFALSNCSNVILYGAASIGAIVKEKFEESGRQICGFIDKRASEIDSFLSLPVWSADAVPLKFERENTVVIVAVKNVFEHDAIANILLEQGFHNIIYKPYGILYDCATSKEKEINQVYECIMNDQIHTCNRVFIPCTMKREEVSLIDFSIIEDGSMVKAYIPIEFVYTNNYTDEGMRKWGNINILALFTHLQYFRYLAGNFNASYQDYLNEYCIYTASIKNVIEITQGWKDNVLRNRAMIYEQMNLSLEIDSDFFVRSAAEAVWNDKGYFNLTSGKHRSSFLASRGYRHIPLKISQSDYLKFANQVEAQKVQCYLAERGDKPFNTPIPNSFFYRRTHLGRELYYGLIERYSCILAKELFEQNKEICFGKIRILELLSDHNMLARHFAKMGCDVSCLAEGEMDTLLDDMLYTTGLLKYEDELQENTYDVVFWNAKAIPAMVEDLKRVKVKKLIVVCNGKEIERCENIFGVFQKVFSSMTDKGLVNVYER